MKISTRAALFAAGMALAAQASALGDVSTENMPLADAEALWNYLQRQDYRRTFRFFPGRGEFYKGAEPHGALLTTYVNSTAEMGLQKTEIPLRAGSIIVKENYTPDKELAAVTVMYKVPGYDPRHNDWFWLKRSADGKLEAAGRIDSCIACHRTSNRDFIMTPLPR